MISNQQASDAYSTVPRRAVSHSITTEPLAPGSLGTYQALEAMSAAVRGEMPPDYQGFNDPGIREIAELTACDAQTPYEQIAQVFNYVIRCIRYVDHPPNQQVIQDALRTILIGSGDCVSMSVLLATLLAALGYRPYFIAQFTGEDEGYSHVYVALNLNGEELRLDPVASNKPMGWSQPLPDGCFETSWRIF